MRSTSEVKCKQKQHQRIEAWAIPHLEVRKKGKILPKKPRSSSEGDEKEENKSSMEYERLTEENASKKE